MKKWTSFTFIFIILAGILSFVGIFTPTTKAYASVNSEFVDFVLTGLQEYYPYTYFDNEDLQQTTYTNKEIFYINEEGQKVNTYRALKNKVTSFLSAKHSSGQVSIPLSGGMKRLVGTGRYFVYASAGLLALDNNDKSKITISLSTSEKTVTATSDKVHAGKDYSPEWVKTEKIYISNPDEIINFSFQNNETSSIFNSAKFYIFEPTISFGYEVENIYCDMEDEDVSQGQLIKLNAETDLSRIEQGGELLSYYKNYHKIQWEIIEGEELAAISGNYLNIIGKSGTVKIRAKCLISDESDYYIYTPQITYTISGEARFLNLTTNFPDGATLLGGGKVSPYEKEEVIFVKVKEGYKLLQILNEIGQDIKTEITPSGAYSAVINVITNRTIDIVLIKEIKIDDIVIRDKYYDKTDSASIKEVIINGILEEHNISVEHTLQAKYSSILAGENIFMNLTGWVDIVGENSYMYDFDSSLPLTYGNILKKGITVTAEFTEKEYGYDDENIKYTISDDIIPGESLMGRLSRNPGETVGEYEINLGTLNNPNYSINFISNVFKINKRNITVSQINVSNREFDNTKKVYKDQINITQDVGIVDENKAVLVLNAEYKSVIGTNIEVYFTINIEGEEADFYNLIVLPTEISSNILPKEIIVIADPQTKEYGEEDPELTFSYDIEEVLEGYYFTGTLTRGTGENAGLYAITKGTLFLENYNIIFQSSNLTISKKKIKIRTDQNQKTYGEIDPELTFFAEDSSINIEDIGIILKREIGENIGEYEIYIDSQMNINYDIEFISDSFIIKKRDLIVDISILEKEYDGKDDAEILYNFQNLLIGEELSINLQAKFSSKDAGDRDITYYTNGEELIEFDNDIFVESEVFNYNVSFGEISYKSRINKKDVYIQCDDNMVFEKQYGYEDPQINYIANGVVEEEILNGNLSRASGENVGNYSIRQGSLTNENNENYNIIFDINKVFIIKKRDLKISIQDREINYGDLEGEIIYIVSEETPLIDGTELTELITGKATREQGVTAGVYQYLIGSLNMQLTNRNNYNLIFCGGQLTINKVSIDITIFNSEKTYGDTDSLFEYEINFGELIDKKDIYLFREPGENVGSYIIKAMFSESYLATFTEGKLEIIPANITIKANNVLRTYGQIEPELKFSIKEGILRFDDDFKNVFNGKLSREEGISVGEYSIKQGSLRINPNYNLSFEEGTFTICKKNIEVYADDIVMFLDEETIPTLTYRVDGLINGDSLSGSLEVENLNGLGVYKISIGSLNSSNYNIQFVESNLTVTKRVLEVVINYVSREYDGTSNAILEYEIRGDIDLEDEEIPSISLFKENGASVGKYLIDAVVGESEKYEIVVLQNYFEIFPRKITIIADDIEITYGESLPNSNYWTYIVDGEIVGTDLNINLYVNQNYGAGEFEILGTITNTNNYEVTFQSGTLKINKKTIYISVPNYVKIYGNSDPHFEYSIQENSLYKNDILQGNITREEGNTVGVYNLICSLFNDNYIIVMNESTLTIEPKEVILVTSALDKVYDSTDIAYLRMPTLSGVVDGDNLIFDYNITELARFEDAEIDDNKIVIVYGGKLIGESAENYYLTRPIGLMASITKAVVEDSLGAVFVYATENNTHLKKGTTIYSLEMDSENVFFGDSKSVVAGYNVSLLYNESVLENYGSLNVVIDLGKQEYFNVQLYRITENGSREIVKSEYIDGKVYFDTEELGTYFVIADNDKWIDYALIGLSASILLLVGGIVFVKERKRHKRKLEK